jgi:hypothetical protein
VSEDQAIRRRICKIMELRNGAVEPWSRSWLYERPSDVVPVPDWLEACAFFPVENRARLIITARAR